MDVMRRRVLTTLAIVAAVLIGFGVGALVVFNVTSDDQSESGSKVDIGFSQDMSVHHAQAVTMAATELRGTTDTSLSSLAYDILTAQSQQIGNMQGWLAAWHAPLASPADVGYMAWMPMDSDMSGMSGHDMSSGASMGPIRTMPGMATDAELAQLSAATGTARDDLFVQLMLRHHLGGMPMMEYGRDHGDSSLVRSLAESMISTQDGEIMQMRQYLKQRQLPELPIT